MTHGSDDRSAHSEDHRLRSAIIHEQRFLDRAFDRRDAELRHIDDQLTAGNGSRPVEPADLARAAGLRRRHGELTAAEQGLVFGRLVGLDGSERYIGRVGIADDAQPDADADDRLVLDWRAGSARVFYTATARDPQGQAWRRHIRTRGRTVEHLDDEPLDGSAAHADLVGAATLLAALNDPRTGRMTAAAATLQREQDEVVRASNDGPLIVQGGPGTGKTVVALHRVAYLLFADERAASRGVLVLGPSERFVDYIGHVLPALGETALVSTTVTELVPGLRVQRAERREAAEIKGRALWQDVLRDYVSSLIPRPVGMSLPLDGERYRIDADRVGDAIRSAAQGRSYHRAREDFADALRELLVEAVAARHEQVLASMADGFEDILDRLDASLARRGERAASTVASSLDTDGVLSDDELERLRTRLAGEPMIDRAVAAFWPVRDAEATVGALLHDVELLRRFAPDLTEADLATVIAEPAAAADSDVALIDAVADLLGDASTRSEQGEFLAAQAVATRSWCYGHVVVDEAQELSAMQWQMILRRCPERSITAVGDMDQASSPNRHRSWADVLRPVLGDRWRQQSLSICYRTPREVLELAQQALSPVGGPLAPAHAVRTSSTPPWTRTCSSDALVATVADLVDELARRRTGNTVGVVAADVHLDRLRTALPQLDITSAQQAKGLEWDAVVVVDPDAITAQPRGSNALYVALTRCTQELVRLSVLASGQ